MTLMQSRRGSFKVVATLGMVLMMALLSACEILATEGARDAIVSGREIRVFEDETLGPLEQEMSNLWTDEISPREDQLNDLRYQFETLQQDLLQPLWDSQNDIWAPGGEASVAQVVFDERYRDLEIERRAIEVDQRDLDARWQTLWNTPTVDTEFQALEDLRYETQRELDRLYRFGNRPIDDLWDQINELNSSQGWANTDSQIESELLNIELRRLYDRQAEIQNSGSEVANDLYNQANEAQNRLQHLYNFGWDPINQLYAEIERLEAEQNAAGSTVDADSLAAQIFELEVLKDEYIRNRDAEVAAYKAELEAVGTESTVVTTTTDTSPETSARIAELEQLIADLEVEAAILVADKNAEKDSLSDQINEIKARYDQLEEDAEQDYQTARADLEAGIDALKTQIDDLEAIGGDDAAAQLALLQPGYDAAIAALEAGKVAHEALSDQLKLDEDAELAGPKADRDAVEALLLSGLTDSIDAQIAEYKAELATLEVGTVTTTVEVSVTRTVEDIEASIAASEAHWNPLIDEIVNKVLVLDNELRVGSSAGTTNDARIHNLRLQAEELTQILNNDISNLEALVNELYRQADAASFDDTGQHAEIQRQIDELNDKLNAIWERDSSNGLEILIKVQQLERQVRVLQEELEQSQYALEEELWEIDDRLSVYYRNQNNGTSDQELAFQAESAVIQQRYQALEEARWTIEEEQRAFNDAMNLKQTETAEAIRLIEKEQLGGLKDQMRVIELELRDFYSQQRVIENAMNDARQLVEEKKRELEDKVFDALEAAAGIAGETVEAGETIEADDAAIGDGTVDAVDPVVEPVN